MCHFRFCQSAKFVKGLPRAFTAFTGNYYRITFWCLKSQPTAFLQFLYIKILVRDQLSSMQLFMAMWGKVQHARDVNQSSLDVYINPDVTLHFLTATNCLSWIHVTKHTAETAYSTRSGCVHLSKTTAAINPPPQCIVLKCPHGVFTKIDGAGPHFKSM